MRNSADRDEGLLELLAHCSVGGFTTATTLLQAYCVQ